MAVPNCTMSASSSTAATPPASIRFMATTSPSTRNPATSPLTAKCRSIWKPIPPASPRPDQATPERTQESHPPQDQRSIFNRTAETLPPMRAWISAPPRPRVGRGRAVLRKNQHAHSRLADPCDARRAEVPPVFSPPMAKSPASRMKSCWIIPAWCAKAEPCNRNRRRSFSGPTTKCNAILATGNVNAESTGQDADQMRARADEAELSLTGKQNLLRTATLTGNVHVERVGTQPMQGDAGRAVLDFWDRTSSSASTPLMESASRSMPPCRYASVKCRRHAPDAAGFRYHRADHRLLHCRGRRLDHAETSGAAKITISPAQKSNPARRAEPPTTHHHHRRAVRREISPRRPTAPAV